MFHLPRLTATALAATLALTAGTAAPARADGSDVAKVLAGVATLYIIGRALSDDDKGAAQAATRGHGNNGYGRVTPRHDNNGYGTVQPRGRGHDRHRAVTLPAYCAQEYRVRGGHADFYGARCLQRAGLTRLPARCAVEVRGQRHGRTAYSERCLLRSGYRVEARRH